MKLKVEFFMESSDLADYVNRRNISKEDIQAIFPKGTGYMMFYWG